MRCFNYIVAGLLVLTSTRLVSCCCGVSYFSPRPQGVNVVVNSLSKDDQAGCFHFSIFSEYSRSFRSQKIAEHFWGTNSLTFSGSRVYGRKKTDILADHFGLPSDFLSTVCFSPIIQNFLIDFGFKLELDCIHDDVYLDIHAPFVHTRWNMRMREQIKENGENFYPAGYASGGNKRLERHKLVADVTTAFKGTSIFGDMQDSIRFGKIDCQQKATGIADIHARLGWNFKNEEDYKLGAALILGVPAGTRVRSEYLFEPKIGNNHHWELGLDFHGWWKCWESEDQTDNCRLWTSVDISHLFNATQRRSFDLKNNGCGSRYMLLSIFDESRDDMLKIPEDSTPVYQYTGHLVPAINQTTLYCQVSIALQADMIFGFAYENKSWLVEGGYNFWIRSKEAISKRDCFKSNRFGVKGDAQVYGFFDLGAIPLQPGEHLDVDKIPVPLNVTQSKATLCVSQLDGNADFKNLNADNALEASQGFDGGTLKNLTDDDSADLEIAQEPISGSNPPILLTDNDIDQCSVSSPYAVSSKLFLNSRYEFQNYKDCSPYIGAGFEIEFGHSCSALSQFGLWLSAGIAY